MLTVGSLFSGIGGIDLGLERAGMRTRWFVEIDPHCRSVLARHWPGLPIFGDIKAIDWSTVEPVDVLAGGFPCQPISAAGKRLAQADERWLWPEFARAIRALRPRFVLVENVANLLRVNGGRAFHEVLADLAALGYDAEWDCIPAAAVGAPHRRDRLWLVAHAAWIPEGGSKAEPGPERERTRESGAPLADAASDRRQQRGTGDDGRGAAASLNGAVGRRSEPVGNGAVNGARLVADAQEQPVGTGLRASGSRGIGRRRSGDSRGTGVLADASRLGRGEGRPESARQQGRLGAASGGDAVADTVVEGLEGAERSIVADAGGRGSDAHATGSSGWSAEPGLGRGAHGLPARLDAHRWPAPPGPQHEWEPSRLTEGKVPNRIARLRGLGNAVVPQVVELVGRRIVALAEER